MNKKDFTSLREEIALKAGTVLENILRDIKLIDSLNKIVKENLQEENNSHVFKTLTFLQESILNRLEKSRELVKEGMIGSLNISFMLEKEVIDREILEKQSDILKEIVLSKENIADWHDFAVHLLKKLNKIHPLDVFFVVSKNSEDISVEIFYMYNFTPEFKIKIKESVIEKVKEEYSVDDEISFEEIHVYKKKKEKNSENIKIFTHGFLRNTPVGGTVGILFSYKNAINPKEEGILKSILSILSLVIGSSKALNTTISELEFYAGHDPLTNLYNRRTFEELLNYEIARAKRREYKFSLILLDLDDFKYINDTYGHQVGDIFLKKVADVIKQSVRQGDIAARIGGDEFAVILSETSLKEAKFVAERLRRNLQNAQITVQNDIKVSVHGSIGLVEFPTHGTSKEELLKAADVSMYKAKKLGKNLIYVPRKNEIILSLKKEEILQEFLKEAIKNKNIKLEFQPIYSKDEKLFGYEVYSRIDFEGKILDASAYIDILNLINKSREHDFVVFEKVREILEKENIKEKIFINISEKTVLNRKYHRQIYELFNGFRNIVFEINEKNLMKIVPIFQDFSYYFRNAGFECSVDNFGISCSPYNFLKFFQVDYVKFAPDFNLGIFRNSKVDIAYLDSLLNLCKNLNIKKIAKNIENEKLYNKLKKFDFDYFQGYLFKASNKQFVLK